MKSNTILVPTDFTKVAENATNHALVIAKTSGAEVILLHVVAKQTDVTSSKSKIDALAESLSKSTGIKVSGAIRVGNIFDDIGDAASELGAKLILMGTHGAKGMQRITGSYALKVITSSAVPFIVVQEKGIDANGYNDIILPIDLSKETKQKLKYATEIATHFKAKVHIVVPEESDEFLKNQLIRNINFAKTYLKENNIGYTAKILNGDFVKELMKYSVAVNGDLICIMSLHGSGGISNVFGSIEEQKILTNEAQIPVLCVNPKEISSAAGKGLFS
jgi:nucleotide-binding universal stress UspA family protein